MYLWDLDHGFAGVVLIKKAGDGSNKIKGCWDSIHVVEVQVFLLTYSTIFLCLAIFVPCIYLMFTLRVTLFEFWQNV